MYAQKSSPEAHGRPSVGLALLMSNNVPSEPISPLLHRREQAVVAATTTVALVLLAIYAWRNGAFDGELIDIDTAAPLSADYRVDVNRASWIELSQLPSVGETLARRIVEWREQHGVIRNVDDLRKVRGVGPKTIASIEPYLTFGSPLNDGPTPSTDASSSKDVLQSRP